MIESSMPEKARDNVVKTVGDIGQFVRTTSAKVVEQAGDVREAAVDTVEKLTTKKADVVGAASILSSWR